MDINRIILIIMVIFMIIGGVDKCFGNKYGYGAKFEEGFMAMGALALAMVGVISLSPVLCTILKPVIEPVYEMIGANTAMFAPTVLANDMGGYPLAMQLAGAHKDIGTFAGLIVGAIGPGGIFVFVIPVAFGILKKEDRPYLAKGILIGIISIPIGCFVGGVTAGFSIVMILINLVPIIIFSSLIALGLWKIPNKMISIFIVFGKFIVVLITLSLVIIVAQTLSGFTIIPGMTPIDEGLITVGLIAITLAGAFPLVHFILKIFDKPLTKLGKFIGVNDVAAAGMIASLANAIPMYGMIKDMDENGKVLSFAFSISAGFVFGDHLGFTAAMNSSMIFPVIVGKFAGGFSALIIGKLFFLRKENSSSV